MGCGCLSKQHDEVASPHWQHPTKPPGKLSPASALKSADRTCSTVVEAGKLHAEEQASAASILQQGRQLHKIVIPEWTEEAPGKRQETIQLTEDPDGLPVLSDRQLAVLSSWQRWSAVHPDGIAVVASRPLADSIRQGWVGDCSFVSSLYVLAAFEQKHGDPVVTGMLHPRGMTGPEVDASGIYECKLFINGSDRRVLLDDRVPVKADGSLLCAHSSVHGELWVTLLEKAFAKIMDLSYDMRGSNPGTDIFHLSSWIPEIVPLKGEKWTSEKIQEIFEITTQGFQAGHCVVCLGTTDLKDAKPCSQAQSFGHSEAVSHSTGLVAGHAYPLLDCRRVGQYRLLFLKNPWGQMRWRGRFSPGDASWSACIQTESAKADGSRTRMTVAQAMGYDVAQSRAHDDGRFWIPIEDVIQHFSHLYLLWSPKALGLQCQTQHGRWNPDPHFTRCIMPDDRHIVAYNPQYHVKLHAKPGPGASRYAIWVVLSRHVVSREDLSSAYVAIHIYSGNRRLCCPEAPLAQGIYSNGECALVRLPLETAQAQSDFIIVVSQHAQKEPFNFTLQLYTHEPCTVTPLPPLVPSAHWSGAAEARWTPETAGGCSNQLWSYFANPQWRFVVPSPGVASMTVFLECPEEQSVNLRLFPGPCARTEDLRQVVSSGSYRQGCCCLEVADVAPGPWVVVVSTFRQGQLADYRLSWHSPAALDLRPLPHPFAMRLLAPLLSQSMPVQLKTLHWLSLRATAASGRKTVLLAVALTVFRSTPASEEVAPPVLRVFREARQPGSGGVKGRLELTTDKLQHPAFAKSLWDEKSTVVVPLIEMVSQERYALQVQYHSACKATVLLNSDMEVVAEEADFSTWELPEMPT